MNTLANKNDSTVKTGTSPIVQPKLMVNAPGDRYEREADAMADKVMRMADSGPTHKPQATGLIAPSIQRNCTACEEKEKKKKQDIIMRKAEGGGGFPASPNLVSQLQASRGSGHFLPAPTRHFMENAFGADFSGVRVHTDGRAAKMSQSIRARAFTYGRDVYFNQGEFKPESTVGKRLLAHELGHVVQQNGFGGHVIQKKDHPYERWRSASETRASEGLDRLKSLLILDDITLTQSMVDRQMIKAFGEISGQHYKLELDNSETNCERIVPPTLMQNYLLAKANINLYDRVNKELALQDGELPFLSNAPFQNVQNKDTQILPLPPLDFSSSIIEEKPNSGQTILPDGQQNTDTSDKQEESGQSLVVWGIRYQLQNTLTYIKDSLIDFYHDLEEFRVKSALPRRKIRLCDLFDSLEISIPNLVDEAYNSSGSSADMPDLEAGFYNNSIPNHFQSSNFEDYLNITSAESNVHKSSGFFNPKLQTDFVEADNQLKKLFLNNLDRNSNTYSSLNYFLNTLNKQLSFEKENKNAIRIPAFFYPKPEKSDIMKLDHSGWRIIEEIPWLFYLKRFGPTWTLTDLTHSEKPENVVREDGLASSLVRGAILGSNLILDPPEELFSKLDSVLRFPKGILYWKYPSGEQGKLTTRAEDTVWQILKFFGITLGVLGTILLSGGTTAAALIALGASAVAGVALQISEWNAKSEQGLLTGKDMGLGTLYILADLLSATVPALKVAKSTNISKTFSQMTLSERMRYIAGKLHAPTKRLDQAVDIINLGITIDLLAQEEEFSQLALTALLSKGLSGSSAKRTKLDIDSTGGIIIQAEGRDMAKIQSKIDDQRLLNLTKNLPTDRLGQNILVKELSIARQKHLIQKKATSDQDTKQIQISEEHAWKNYGNGYWCRHSNGKFCVLLGEGMEGRAVREVGFGNAGIRNTEGKRAREELRRNIRSQKPGKGWQAHHIIPFELRHHKVIDYLSRKGWNINGASNGIYLPENLSVRGKGTQSIHFGSHPIYNDWIESRLNIIEQRWANGEILDGNLQNELTSLTDEFRHLLDSGRIRLRLSVAF